MRAVTPPRALILKAVDGAIESRHAEAVYLTGLFVTGCVSAALLWIGRRLSR